MFESLCSVLRLGPLHKSRHLFKSGAGGTGGANRIWRDPAMEIAQPGCRRSLATTPAQTFQHHHTTASPSHLQFLFSPRLRFVSTLLIYGRIGRLPFIMAASSLFEMPRPKVSACPPSFTIHALTLLSRRFFMQCHYEQAWSS